QCGPGRGACWGRVSVTRGHGCTVRAGHDKAPDLVCNQVRGVGFRLGQPLAHYCAAVATSSPAPRDEPAADAAVSPSVPSAPSLSLFSASSTGLKPLRFFSVVVIHFHSEDMDGRSCTSRPTCSSACAYQPFVKPVIAPTVPSTASRPPRPIRPACTVLPYWRLKLSIAGFGVRPIDFDSSQFAFDRVSRTFGVRPHAGSRVVHTHRRPQGRWC